MARTPLLLASLLPALAALSLAPSTAAEPGSCRQAQGRSSRYRWCENRLTRMSPEERRALLTGTPPVATAPGVPVPSPPPAPPPPPAPGGSPSDPDFDWHDLNGEDWMSGVRDQGSCGACFVFSSVGAVEGMYKWIAADPTIDIDLSEQSVISCITFGSCENGGLTQEVGQRLKDFGAPEEACYPYTESTGDCAELCADWQARAARVTDWHTSVTPWSEAEIKNHLVLGPVVANMQVYDDFYGYSGGVYSRSEDASAEGWHAVAIVGWDDADNSWIARNSWSDDWGEQGYFKISRVADCLVFITGTCFASNTLSFDVVPSNVPGLACAAEQELALSAMQGQTVSSAVNVTNCGLSSAISLSAVATPDAPWLAWEIASPLLDVGASLSVNVVANAIALEPGVHQADLRLIGGPGSDVVHVTFTVEAQPVPDAGTDAGAGGAGGVGPGPDDDRPNEEEGGCGCRAGGVPTSQALVALGVGLLALGLRRRRGRP